MHTYLSNKEKKKKKTRNIDSLILGIQRLLLHAYKYVIALHEFSASSSV